MTALTSASRAQRTQSIQFATRAALALLVWIGAAVTVASANTAFAAMSTAAVVAAKAFAIVVFAYAYMRATRDCTLDHALLVGVAWLFFGIMTEVIMSARTGHSWASLLGPASHPLARDVLLFVWLAAPALFARQQDEI